MKKLICILFAVLLLAGCSDDVPESTPAIQTIPTTTIATEPTQVAAQPLYLPASAIETATNGAIRGYALAEGQLRWIAAMGEQLLAITDDADIVVLSGEEAIPVCSIQGTQDLLQPELRSCVTADSFSYYAASTNEVICLNSALKEIDRITLPADMVGLPVISPVNQEIFYCTGTQIRAITPSDGKGRLVKQCAQTLLGAQECLFDGELLVCTQTDSDGSETYLYVSTQTGETVYSADRKIAYHTENDRYFAICYDGTTRLQLFGDRKDSTSVKNLDAGREDAVYVPLYACNVALTYHWEDEKLNLACFSLASGKKSAQIGIEFAGQPAYFAANGDDIWFLMVDEHSGSSELYMWQLEKSGVGDQTVYTKPVYTDDSPDTEGLSVCKSRAQALNKKYGVDIRIWENAQKATDGYEVVPEYQVPAINKSLDLIDATLSELPEWFIWDTVEGTDSRRLQIHIVRSIDNEEPVVQYWKAANAYILLSAGRDLRLELLQAIGYAVDTHVLGNTAQLDGWNDLNPSKFMYIHDHIAAADDYSVYLSGEKQAFANVTALRSATDDRAQLWALAMSEDSQEIFQKETMQAKLMKLCRGIRYAYGLRKSPEEFPWERYLEKSMAYQE